MDLSEYLLITDEVADRLDDLRRTADEPDEPVENGADPSRDEPAGQPAVTVR